MKPVMLIGCLIIAVAAEASAAPAATVPPLAQSKTVESNPWTATVGAGLQFITGNAQTLMITANAAAKYKWMHWAFGVNLNGAYALANPRANQKGSTAAVAQRRAQGLLRFDRSLNTLAALFIIAGAEFDHMKNIQSRSYGEFGTGLTFIDLREANNVEKLYFRFDAAIRAGYETRLQYFPVETAVDTPAIVLLAPRAAIQFRWKINEYLSFTERLEFIPLVLEPVAGRLLINNNAKLATRIADNANMTLAVLIRYDSLPPAAPPPSAARLTTDVAVLAGIEAKF